MKQLFKHLIVTILEIQAKRVLLKYKPKIIAVTGSVGKTSTKDAIYTILSPFFFVRKSEKSFNSEIGVPLTILGCQNAWNNPIGWIKNILHGFELIFYQNDYPAILVLEVGADQPGDIFRITQWMKPDVTVVTRIGTVPVHVEAFKNRQELINEKAHLVRALKKGGTLILNVDDDDVIGMRALSREKVITFGIHRQAEITASNERVLYENNAGIEQPVGFSFKVDFGGNSVPLVLKHVMGLQHLYPVLAAVAVGVSQNLNMVEITQAMSDHVPPRGRMNVLKGINGSVIIDDTYNSSPVALGEALEAFKRMDTVGRKIAVLGDMLELGKFSTEEHKMAGRIVATIAKKLVAVGVRARLMKDGALENKMHIANMFFFDKSTEAAPFIKRMIKPGDLVLVKGSQSMRMERVVKELLAEPEKASELLVRQEPEWLAKK